MLIQIERNSNKKFIYQQIYETIKEKILHKDLTVHEKLPSKRQLATQLQVSINTVTLAYEQLLTEGYIYTVERSGYFVEEIMTFDVDKIGQGLFPEDLKENHVNREDWLSLSHMSMNSDYFPFKSWFKHQTEAVRMFSKELCDLPEQQGPYILRKNIARLIKLTRGVNCEPEQIIIHSTSQGLMQQLIALHSKDSVYAIENPGYARYFKLLTDNRVTVKTIPLDKNGVSIKILSKSNSDFLITTPSHQFPTGRIMPISRRVELLNWTLENENRYIIEDDYDSEFKYKTDNIPSLQSLDYNQRVIYMGTFSKTLLPGIRISYMILPPNLLRKYKQHFSSFIQPANILALYTLNYFIESGDYQKHVRKMNNVFSEIRTILINKLINRFGSEIEIVDIPAGLHFLVKVNTKKTYEEIEQELVRQKLELYTIRRFLIAKSEDYINNRFIVIGFANINPEKIDLAIQRLDKVLF